MKNRSLSFQIISYLMLFIIFILGVFFIFQSFLIENIYRDTKIENLKNINNEIAIALNDYSSNLGYLLKKESYNNDACIRIITSELNIYASNEEVGCDLAFLKNDDINEIFNILKNKNSFLKRIKNQQFDGELLIYGSLINQKGQQMIILSSTKISAFNAAFLISQKQFFVYSFFIILATFLLGLILSKKIIKPLKGIISQIKVLPDGKYQTSNLKNTNSELQKLDQVLVLANEKIIESNKAKKELISNVSHDLKTPLSMIVGYGEMIRDIKEENNKENIEVIIEEAKRLNLLVDDLLQLNKFQNNKIVFNYEKYYVNNLLKEVFKQFEKIFEKYDIEAKLKLLTKDKEVFIDVFRLKQVLYNFINNAMFYNEKEKKIVVFGAEEFDNRIKVFVYDNGNGIEEKERDKVFERYYRNSEKHLRFKEGSGIGLAVSKEILLAHNLEFGIESELNKYTIFYFLLQK